jgi:hypothetical protein
LAALAVTLGVTGALAAPAGAAVNGSVGGFSFGELTSSAVGAKGCGTNSAGEPAIHVDRANNVFLGSELGVGSGSEFWRGLDKPGGAAARACTLQYRGQPNAVSGVGASGGDIDVALASAKNPAGFFNVYVASLNLGSINVATSLDRATTFTSESPVQGGVPVDDREWIAAFGASTALLTYHDLATGNIDVLKSVNSGQSFTQTTTAIPPTDYKAMNNELGNLVIDHRNVPATPGAFFAYQVFVAPSTSSGSNFNEAFMAVSNDGGVTFTDHPITCSTAAGRSLDHNFPNVSVAPNGDVWAAWSNDAAIRTAVSHDHGSTWSCSKAVSTTPRSIFPWLAATSNGVDLVYYAAPTTGAGQTWYVYFAQNPTATTTGWTAPQQLMPVHSGAVCESGATCTTGRQLFDDFGIDTDRSGWAHIAYSHDAPDLGGSGTFTGYAVQTSGTRAGKPNN